MTVSGLTTTKAVNYTIQPYRYTTIGNFSASYTINTTIGLTVYPALYYPDCPSFQGPESFTATNPLQCYLYDSRSNLITMLNNCQITPNQVAAGSTYSIKFAYVPDPT